MNPEEAKSYIEERGYKQYPIETIPDTDPIVGEIKGFRAKEGSAMRAVVIGFREGSRMFKVAVAGGKPDFFRVVQYARNALLMDEVILAHDGRFVLDAEAIKGYKYGSLDATNSLEAISINHLAGDKFRAQLFPYRRRHGKVTWVKQIFKGDPTFGGEVPQILHNIMQGEVPSSMQFISHHFYDDLGQKGVITTAMQALSKTMSNVTVLEPQL